jgi:hypothetical protein
VTLGSGPFAGGTTQQISTIKLHLEQWYEQDSRHQRVAKMFCPAHAESGLVEGDGDNLGQSSQMDQCPPAEQSARQSGVVGHSQKTARARANNRQRHPPVHDRHAPWQLLRSAARTAGVSPCTTSMIRCDSSPFGSSAPSNRQNKIFINDRNQTPSTTTDERITQSALLDCAQTTGRKQGNWNSDKMMTR